MITENKLKEKINKLKKKINKLQRWTVRRFWSQGLGLALGGGWQRPCWTWGRRWGWPWWLWSWRHFGGKGEKGLGHLFILLSNTVNEIGGYYKADLSLFSNSYLGTSGKDYHSQAGSTRFYLEVPNACNRCGRCREPRQILNLWR